jgi:hypothetical protein
VYCAVVTLGPVPALVLYRACQTLKIPAGASGVSPGNSFVATEGALIRKHPVPLIASPLCDRRTECQQLTYQILMVSGAAGRSRACTGYMVRGD